MHPAGLNLASDSAAVPPGTRGFSPGRHHPSSGTKALQQQKPFSNNSLSGTKAFQEQQPF